MTNDASSQVEQEQDVMEGLELDPVTEEASEQEGQSEIVPDASKAEKPETDEGKESGAAKKPNADNKERRIIEKKTKISQEEWQETQETIATLKETNEKMQRDNFEARNPIVTSEKNKEKWDNLCAEKSKPDSKYHRLDYSDLKKLLVDDSVAEENEEVLEEFETSQRRPVTAPITGHTNGSSKKNPGGVDSDTYSILKSQGYTDEQIADSGNISLVGSRR